MAKGQQASIQEAASMAVSEALIPALENFINRIKKAAGFFAAMEQEFMKFENRASNAVDHPKKLHYKVMKKEACRDMKSTCQIFYAVLPDVRIDFLAIPTEGTDQNYVDQWLEKQQKTIRENCRAPGLAGKILKAIMK